MTQVWSEDDRLIPVTVIQAGPCIVTQIKTADKEGYEAIQIGYGTYRTVKKGDHKGEYKGLTKPQAGHFKKAEVEPAKVLREVRVENASSYELGQAVTVEGFAEVKLVHVTGVSKGKGFAGVIKRHNFSGGPGGHGSHFHRAPASIGQCATPSRVFKGKKLPGHMGTDTVTVKNLEVIKIDSEQNLILVKGAVPGGKGALLSVRTA